MEDNKRSCPRCETLHDQYIEKDIIVCGRCGHKYIIGNGEEYRKIKTNAEFLCKANNISVSEWRKYFLEGCVMEAMKVVLGKKILEWIEDEIKKD